MPNKSESLLQRANDTIRFISAATPAKAHGWALGIIDRSNETVNDVPKGLQEGYNLGWDEMDKAMATDLAVA